MRIAIALTKQEKELARWPFRGAYYTLLLGGLAALGFAGYQVLDAHRYQTVEKAKFEAAVALPAPEALPDSENAGTRVIASGSVIGEIEMPRVGLKAIVVQGDSLRLLNRAVGHLPDSPLPGENGNVALAAHRDGLFRPLRAVQPGDAITLRTADREFQYEVLWTAVVPPTAVGVLEPTSEPVLTLVTCFPFYYVGPAPERFVVRAREVESQTPHRTEFRGSGDIQKPRGF